MFWRHVQLRGMRRVKRARGSGGIGPRDDASLGVGEDEARRHKGEGETMHASTVVRLAPCLVFAYYSLPLH